MISPALPLKDLLLFMESRLYDLSSRNGKNKGLNLSTIMPVSECLKNPPPPRDYLFKEVLPSGIVGELVAMGGTGKGHLNIMLGLSLATGREIGPLKPARNSRCSTWPRRMTRRNSIAVSSAAVEALWPDGSPPPEIDNFIPVSVMGKLGPLMQFDRRRNPVNAPAYDWLCKTLENLPDVEVLILDPKSKFYGLDENDNAIAPPGSIAWSPWWPGSRSPSSFLTTRAKPGRKHEPEQQPGRVCPD